MYLNINRKTSLLLLQRYMATRLIAKSSPRSSRCCGLALSHGLVLRIGLNSLRCDAFVASFSPQKMCQSFSLIFVLFAGTMG